MVTNPALINELRAEGKTIDFEMIWNVFLDISNYQKKGDFIRELSEQEQQAVDQPSSEDQIRMQMQRERIEGTNQRQDKALAAEAEKEAGQMEQSIIKGLIPGVAKEALNSD
jgi:hypothetical protein